MSRSWLLCPAGCPMITSSRAILVTRFANPLDIVSTGSSVSGTNAGTGTVSLTETSGNLTVGAADPRVSALIGIAPPLARYDFEPVAASPKPKFFIQGEMDELCFLRDMRVFYARAAEPKELVVIDGADHVFDGKGREVADAIEDLLGDWRDLGSVRLPRAEPRGRQPDRGSR